MSESPRKRVIPLTEYARSALLAVPAPLAVPRAPVGVLHDTLGRELRDLRISVTDRCNFRCSYCMPKDVFHHDYPYLPHSALLSFEEITRLTRLFVAHGVRKVRLTGGEPLLRKNIEVLIEQLASLRTADNQPLDLTLTTNGSLLERKARALRAAGLQRVTVSLDGLDDTVFRAMNDVDFPVRQVLDGIAAAREAGLWPIKVNMVVKRGVNDGQVLPMARYFKGTGIVLRFIEYMDVGSSNGWRMHDVVPSAELLSQLRQEMPLVALPAERAGRVLALLNEKLPPADKPGSDVHDDRQRHTGFLRRLQPRPPLHGRPALSLPVRQPRPRSAPTVAPGLRRCRTGKCHCRHLAAAR